MTGMAPSSRSRSCCVAITVAPRAPMRAWAVHRPAALVAGSAYARICAGEGIDDVVLAGGALVVTGAGQHGVVLSQRARLKLGQPDLRGADEGGSSPTKPGGASTARWCGSGKRDGGYDAHR